MKKESFKEALKYLDKKTLRKLCVSFKKQIEDKEVEIFCLKENAEKQKKEFKSLITRETIRADSKELLSESLERILQKIITDDKDFDYSLSDEKDEKGVRNYEENNIKKPVVEKL